MEEVKIQLAKVEDEKQIKLLITSCFDIKTYNICIAQQETSFSIIATYQNRIIGHVRVDQLHDVFKGISYYLLNYVCVDSKFRNQGIATQLLSFIEKLAKERNISYIELTSQPSRVAANHLYQHNGFIIKKTNLFHKEIN